MKHIILFSSLVIGIFFLGCGNATSSKSQPKAENSNESSCLEQFMDTPCDILTAEKVIELTGLEASKLELKEPMMLKVARRFECVYLWDSGRTEETDTAAGNIETKLNDKIDLGHFRKYDPSKDGNDAENWFQRSYPTVTKEALAAREARYNEKLAKGEKDMGESMVLRTLKTITRTRIEGLGDRALVDTHTTWSAVTIIVMHKNISFQVSVDISKDVEKNLEVAKKVVSSVLESCD